LRLEIRIFVHSPVHLSLYFCTVIRPGPCMTAQT